MNTPRHDTRLDRFVDNYAVRTHGMRVSAVRALFAVANRPEIVSLAGGMPNIKDLGLDAIADNVARLIRDHGARVMQYGSGQGEPEIREKICEVMALESILADPDDLVVTAGSQQGLDLVTRVFCNPGDVVLAESPSYVGALGTFLSYECEVAHVPSDDDGLDAAALRETIRRVRSAGKNVKFLYTIPNFNNPSGLLQPVERRREILDVCSAEQVMVVEDNPYGLLTLESEPLPAMRSMDPEVIYLGSFSKIFAPGFRVGWVLAPHAVREKLTLAQESATLCPPVFSQFAISDYLEHYPWQQQIVSYRDMYRGRRDAMLEELARQMPDDVTWTEPKGGFFVWLTLPDGIDAQAMLPRGVNARVAYVPGAAFYVDGQGTNNIRLSYCFPTAERIREGVRRLGKVIRSEVDMQQVFGTTTTHPHRFNGPGPMPDLS